MSFRKMHYPDYLEFKDKDGKTPLLTATAFGSVEAMDLLVPAGTDVPDGVRYSAVDSATDGCNNNVIHLAVETGDVSVLKVSKLLCS